MRKKLKLIPVNEAYIEGKHETGPQPSVDVPVPPSGLTELRATGKKCTHGVYIPANTDKAHYCYVCTPYVIRTKADA